jgi:hypothetical protein
MPRRDTDSRINLYGKMDHCLLKAWFRPHLGHIGTVLLRHGSCLPFMDADWIAHPANVFITCGALLIRMFQDK